MSVFSFVNSHGNGSNSSSNPFPVITESRDFDSFDNYNMVVRGIVNYIVGPIHHKGSLPNNSICLDSEVLSAVSVKYNIDFVSFLRHFGISIYDSYGN